VPRAKLNGIEIHYARMGQGPRLLYVNGSGATLATTQMLFAPFAERFDLLAHDQRGLGLTDVPPGPYTMADYAADAAAQLDHVGGHAFLAQDRAAFPEIMDFLAG
jgi:3-oxoadipate enol-lactonase